MNSIATVHTATSLPAWRYEWLGWGVLLVGTYAVASVMTTDSIAIASCAILLVSSLLVRRSTYLFNPKRIAITTFWYLSFIAMLFLPAFFVYADQVGPYRARFLFAVESLLITVPFGWYVASSVASYQRFEIDRYFCRALELPHNPDRRRRRFLLLLAISVAFTAAYVAEVRTIPLIYLFRHPGDYLELAILREESLKLLDSPLTYIYYVVRGLLYPFLITVSFGCLLCDRQSRWRRWFLISLFLGVFYASLSLAKAPVAMIMLLLGVFFYLYRRGQISRKALVLWLVIVLLFPVVVILSVSSAQAHVGIGVAVAAVGFRLLYLPAEVVYYYFEVFPAKMHFLHGRSIDKFARLLGEPYFDTRNYVGNYGYPQYLLESISANGAFVSDLNADFGIPGVLVGGVIAGIIMQSLHIYLVRRRKTVVSLACYAYLIVAFWYLHSTSLPIVLASNGVIFVLVLRWFLEPRRDDLSRKLMPSPTGNSR